jgi:hypothetical protein
MDACECNDMPRHYGTWPRGTKRALRYVFSCQQCALVVSMTCMAGKRVCGEELSGSSVANACICRNSQTHSRR